ncbi:UNVERIFIED_CONTAM: hypothetical protein RMT77_009562 [Armadillidium vulgare]
MISSRTSFDSQDFSLKDPFNRLKDEIQLLSSTTTNKKSDGVDYGVSKPSTSLDAKSLFKESLYEQLYSLNDGAETSNSKTDHVRTVVFVRKDRNSPFERASFSECLFDYFDCDPENQCLVECFVHKNRVFVQLPPASLRTRGEKAIEKWRKLYILEHPVFCAIHRLRDEMRASLPEKIALRGVDVGVSVILESSDSKILLTRRAHHLNAFPGVWVSPGGHMEEGEDFEDAALREISQETGLKVEKARCRILGLFESVFPPVLYEGEPTRHHLVIYLSIRHTRASKELQESIQLDPNEVDASMWIPKDLVSRVCEGGAPRKTMMDIPITLVHSDGSHTEGKLDPKVLRKKMPAPGRIVERITTGTRFALRQWLNTRKS